jgi:hypothetical protein
MCVTQNSRRVTVLDEVMTTFFTAGVSRDATVLAQLCKTRLTARENFVYVGLMAGVPQHSIGGGFENSVQCDGKFDSSQVGTKVSTSFGDRTDNEFANLFGELIELGKR